MPRQLVGHLILACRRPLEESPLIQDIVAADGEVLPLSRDEKAAVETMLSAGAVPTLATPPAVSNTVPAAFRLPGISEHPTPSSPAAAAAEAAPPVPPLPPPPPPFVHAQPLQRDALSFLASEQPSPATRNGPVAGIIEALKRTKRFLIPAGNAKQRLIRIVKNLKQTKRFLVPVTNAKQWLIHGGLVILAAVLVLVIWAVIPGRKQGEQEADEPSSGTRPPLANKLVGEPLSPKTTVVDLGGGVSLELVLIPAGSFMMGDDSEKPVHKVNITRPFYLGEYLVTQEQWEAVMGNNPSAAKD